MQSNPTSQYNLAFWIHLFITVLSWFAAFLFDWRVVVVVFLIIWLQFRVFGRCLLNKAHGLDTREGNTFYNVLLETAGFKTDHLKVKKIVHGWLYILLAALAVVWQVGLGIAPLIF